MFIIFPESLVVFKLFVHVLQEDAITGSLGCVGTYMNQSLITQEQTNLRYCDFGCEYS